MEVSQAGEAHPPFPLYDDVFDAVEFYFIDVLVDDAGVDAEALVGELEGLAADGEVGPEGVGGGDDEADECGWKGDGGCGDAGGDEEG